MADMDAFSQWWVTLMQPSVLIELAVLLLCFGLALGAVAWLRYRFRGQLDPRSIWLGRNAFDGVLFPLLLLCLSYVARAVLWKYPLVLLGASPVGVFRIAIPVLVALVVIRVGVKVLRAALAESFWVRAMERTISWVAWVGLVLWVSGLLPAVLQEADEISWKMGSTTLSLRTLIEGGLTAGVVLLLALWIASAIEARLLRAATGSSLSLRKAISNAARALLVFVGIVVALSAVGIDLTALSVLGGAIGVGLGFGLQKLAANYVSGFVILAERSIRIGDVIMVDNFEGRVSDISTRCTVIRALNGREAIVPNEMMITSVVQNLSLCDTQVVGSTVIGVAYDSDVELVRRLMLEAATSQPRVLTAPAPSVQLSAFGADGLEFTLHFWIADPENGLGALRSDINWAILQAFRAHGVEIPFPQRVVHVKGGGAAVVDAG